MTSIRTYHSAAFSLLLFTGMSLLSPGAYAAVNIGQPAPGFTGTDSNGVQHTLQQYQGRTVVLEWTNHDCPYVRKHYQSNNMQNLQKQASADGVVWLTIISSAPGKQGHVSARQANELSTSRGAAPAAVILDPSGDIGRAYGAKTTPHMYIIDKAGTLVYMGGIDNIPSADMDDIQSATNYVRAALGQLSGGQPIRDSVTRPYGCSVKY